MGYRLTSGARAILRGKPAGGPPTSGFSDLREVGIEERITLDGLRALVEATEGWSGDTPVHVRDTPFATRIEVQVEDEA